jgi:hypothetical protein
LWLLGPRRIRRRTDSILLVIAIVAVLLRVIEGRNRLRG